MTDRCLTCGQELPSLAAIAISLQVDAQTLQEAARALETMRLALPSVVPSIVRGTAVRWPVLASALACHAGLFRAQR